MHVESFMKIEAPSDVPAGDSTDETHTGEIEILSFEHSMSRSPNRSFRAELEVAERKRRVVNQLSRPSGGASRMPGGFHQTVARAERQAEEATQRLAATLQHHPVSVLKPIDKATPLLNFWAAKTDALLTNVTLTCRTTIASAGETQLKDLLQVKLTGVFICGLEIVGSYPDQPWLSDGSPALWQSIAPLARGPVEKVVFGYKKYEVFVDARREFGWDAVENKSFT